MDYWDCIEGASDSLSMDNQKKKSIKEFLKLFKFIRLKIFLIKLFFYIYWMKHLINSSNYIYRGADLIGNLTKNNYFTFFIKRKSFQNLNPTKEHFLEGVIYFNRYIFYFSLINLINKKENFLKHEIHLLPAIKKITDQILYNIDKLGTFLGKLNQIMLPSNFPVDGIWEIEIYMGICPSTTLIFWPRHQIAKTKARINRSLFI